MSQVTGDAVQPAVGREVAAFHLALDTLFIPKKQRRGRAVKVTFQLENKRLQFVTKLVEQVASGAFDDEISRAEFDVPKPLEAADVVSRVAGSPSAEATAVGPVVNATTLSGWKGVSKTALTKAQDRRELLGFKSGGIWLYPTFQLNEYGEYLPGLPRVLTTLDPNRSDDGSSAIWLNQPLVALEGRTAAEALRDEDIDAVVRAASHVSYGWAS